MRHPKVQRFTMSYKPYPSSDKPQLPAERRPAPQSVLNAVKLMCTGAAISTVSLILSLTTTGSLKSAIRKHYPHYDTSQVNHLYGQILAAAIISAVIGVLLWLFMAWANGKGMAWARIVSCVLFAFNTIGLLAFFRQPETVISLIFEVLVWLVGLAAIWFLWRPESSAFFKPQSYS
jgi:hypothetical protein